MKEPKPPYDKSLGLHNEMLNAEAAHAFGHRENAGYFGCNRGAWWQQSPATGRVPTGYAQKSCVTGTKKILL